jgi:hypothetical protein
MTYHTPLRVALALVCVTSLAACSGRSGAEEAVRQVLKDPDSARFGEFYFNEETKKGCLAVNARNAMGGYTGEQQAYVERTENGWETDGIAEIDQAMCRRIHADSQV